MSGYISNLSRMNKVEKVFANPDAVAAEIRDIRNFTTEALNKSEKILSLALENAAPIIGENCNWYVYDIKQGDYVDSGVSAVGGGGGSGLTEEQRTAIEKIPTIVEAIGDIDTALDRIKDIQNELIGDVPDGDEVSY